MKNLFLLRHCEAYHFEENKSDHEKQLNENGRKSARLLKNWFEKNDIILDYILTSSANRTLTTANIIFSNYENKIYQKKGLYLCDFKEILKEIKLLDNNFNSVVIVGHEPSISESLKFLTSYCRPDLEYVAKSLYPTGGLSVINFNVTNWNKIDEKTGILDAFITPQYLEEYEKNN
ncbi:histidine phosphatase family protein [Alphaproteobacteria bacterium]|nr:histidine phosphatase family protein [Alphaproteobacteria bacterium]